MTGMTPERLASIRRELEDQRYLAESAVDAGVAVPSSTWRSLDQAEGLLAEVKRLRDVVAVADRVAASLGLVLHDAHPTYGSTALWSGGIGGQALTSHCSIINGAHPGGEWAEFDLPSHYLREWASLRGADYDHDEMKATVRADLLALLNPTGGETDVR